MCLDLLLSIARQHKSCSSEEARIEGDAVVIPFDQLVDGGRRWIVVHERVRNRRELLEAFGY